MVTILGFSSLKVKNCFVIKAVAFYFLNKMLNILR